LLKSFVRFSASRAASLASFASAFATTFLLTLKVTGSRLPLGGMAFFA
jgi:hypothetical protein